MENLQKDFVPYDRALKLKQLGFDEPCIGFFFDGDDENEDAPPFHSGKIEFMYDKPSKNCINSKYNEYEVSSPTFSQAFRWFREKYNLIAEFNWHFPSKCYATSIYPNDFYLQTKSYEQAELACLDKLIEIIESKSE